MVDFPGFEAHPVDLPDAAEMPLHVDAGERLCGAEIRFRCEVRGPESVTFDPRGRGPYTGVANGRVLIWDGARSAYLAHASPAWTVDLCGGPKAFPTEYLMDEHVYGRALGIRGAAVGLFGSQRLQLGGFSLKDLAANAVPYEESYKMFFRLSSTNW
ncbi:protein STRICTOSIDINE SYNTHASE-LIKE 3-like [Hordeum vulgare]|nr:protein STRICTOSIDINE SYNTHASE-LIKE 3-like [Hordeum vulgare]